LSPLITFGENGTILNGKFIFQGSTALTGNEIFVTDGTVAGTMLLKDILLGPLGSAPDNDMAVLNGFVYFTASTPQEGRELWRTDGTPNGTTFVKDVIPGIAGSNVANGYDLFSNGSFLLFSAQTASSGEELWKSDGTDAGTVPLKDINPGAPSSNPTSFFSYNNIVLFAASDALHGTEVWKTDGTTGGTVMLKDIREGTNSSVNIGSVNTGISNLFLVSIFNGRAYFSANNGTNGGEIWSTDGTEANTRILKDIEPGTGSAIPFIFFGGLQIGNKLIFSATTTEHGTELWESDGTENGTKIFKDIVPGTGSSSAFILSTATYNPNTTAITYPLFQGNKFFVVASTPEKGTELYISDGTSEGTVMVKDINPNEESGATISSVVYTSSALFFTANDGQHGEELWKSDGTEAGTVMVTNINTQVEDGDEEGSDVSLAFTLVNNKLIFGATEGDNPANDLYIVDGNLSTLPVTLSSFTVMQQGNDGLLNWSTVTEVNTKSFAVQRSEDGMKFNEIGKVAATGTSTVRQNYQFLDKGIVNSGRAIVYYKLTTTDNDGKSTTSSIITLKLKGSAETEFKLLGNPVQSDVMLLVKGVTKPVSLSIKDMAGRTVGNSIIKANGQISISTAHLMPGVYVITVENDSLRKVLKFVKR
ncbi:MAG TPA: T9SS type A sorting domain-containing protein, partial [Segetibacter sp.]